jgi:hypothetical protein
MSEEEVVYSNIQAKPTCDGITICSDLCTCLGWFGECTISCDSKNSSDVTYGGVTCRCSH